MEGCKELTADISSVAGCLQALTIQLDIRVRVHISSFSGHKSTRKYRILVSRISRDLVILVYLGNFQKRFFY